MTEIDDEPITRIGRRGWMFWTGWVLSGLPILMLGVLPIFMFVFKRSAMAEGAIHLGYPAGTEKLLLALELSCAVLYAIPRSAVLGAILMTGYLGGAIASHVRLGEPQLLAGVIFGVIAWLGLYLRDSRVRALIPIRRMDGDDE